MFPKELACHRALRRYSECLATRVLLFTPVHSFGRQICRKRALPRLGFRFPFRESWLVTWVSSTLANRGCSRERVYPPGVRCRRRKPTKLQPFFYFLVILRGYTMNVFCKRETASLSSLEGTKLSLLRKSPDFCRAMKKRCIVCVSVRIIYRKLSPIKRQYCGG